MNVPTARRRITGARAFSLPLLAAALLVALILPALSGCAGTAGNALNAIRRPQAPTSGAGPFTPNYLDEIVSRRFAPGVVTYRIVGGASALPGVDTPRAIARGLHRWDGALRLGGVTLAPAAPGEDPAVEIRVVTGREIREFLEARGVELRGTPIGVAWRRVGPDGRLVRSWAMIDRGLVPTRMEATAAHEIGHALGILGHSPSAADVMYPTVPVLAALSQRDQNTMASIYAAVDGVDGAPAAGRAEAAPDAPEVCGVSAP